jgi:hypothetical protein
MSSKAYNDHPGIRWSRASAGLASGLQLAHEQANGRADTAALGLGRTVHVITLLPGAPVPVVPGEHLTPSGTLSTGKKTENWAEECAAFGLEYSTPADIEKGRAIAAKVNAHPVAAQTLAICKVREVPVYADLPDVGAAKCCPDLYDPDTGMMGDLKTHSGRGPMTLRSVMLAILKWNYAAQMAFYRRVMAEAGMKLGEVRLIFVDSSAPHDVAVVRLSDDWLAYGEAEVDKALAVWAAVVAGTVEGIAPGLVDLELPAWLAETADSSDVDDLGLEGVE